MMFGVVRVVRSRKFVVIGFVLQTWPRHVVPSIRQCMWRMSVGMDLVLPIVWGPIFIA